MTAAGPRQHRDPAFLAAKYTRSTEPHVAPVNRLAARIAAATDSVVPGADPDGGGIHARVLLLLETPSRAGGYTTGLISIDNDDTAAANLWRALHAVGLDRRLVLVWNAVPWYVGSADKIRSPHRPRSPRDRPGCASCSTCCPTCGWSPASVGRPPGRCCRCNRSWSPAA